MLTANPAFHLPSVFRRDESSNNYKLLEINHTTMEGFHADLQDVYNSRSIEQATGKSLDLIGSGAGQKRGQKNDVQYRYLILNKIGRNQSAGNQASVQSAIAQMLGCDLSDVQLQDTDVPCQVKFVRFPVSKLAEAGFTLDQVAEMVGNLLPTCVTCIIQIEVESAGEAGLAALVRQRTKHTIPADFQTSAQSSGAATAAAAIDLKIIHSVQADFERSASSAGAPIFAAIVKNRIRSTVCASTEEA